MSSLAMTGGRFARLPSKLLPFVQRSATAVLLVATSTVSFGGEPGTTRISPVSGPSTLRIKTIQDETPAKEAAPKPLQVTSDSTARAARDTSAPNEIVPVTAIMPVVGEEHESNTNTASRRGVPTPARRNEPTPAKPIEPTPAKPYRPEGSVSSRRPQTSTGGEEARIAKALENMSRDSDAPRPLVTEESVSISESPLYIAERDEMAQGGLPPSVSPPPGNAPLAAPSGPGPSPSLIGSPFEVIDESDTMTVMLRRSRILRSKVNIFRTAVVDPSICNVIQFTPREVSIIGEGQGATHVTFWFEGDEQRPITYLVKVIPDPEVQARREQQYKLFEEILAELFPDSKIRLQVVADKLLVKGEAKDSEEAAQIMAVIRGEAVRGGSAGDRGYGSLVDGRAADPISGEDRDRRLPATQIINLLRVPGEQQVALRVKIAELNRSAARSFGVDLDAEFTVGNGSILLQSMLNASAGGSPSVIGHFDGDKVNFGIHFLEQNGVVRVLSEPTLVTMSGRPATFHAGGEFAVPTVVGVQGVGAVTTEFRSFGAIISFLPVVLDKDRIRLEVAPEFSKINSKLSVDGTPGLDTRAVTTTVEMREGQTLAIAGLLDDAMASDRAGDLPFFYHLFGRRTVTRNETELIILVTPELVHALDPEEVPPLPGFDVTEPTHDEFYFGGQTEGRPTHEHRSTVWPILRKRYQNGGQAMMSGPFGHGQ